MTDDQIPPFVQSDADQYRWRLCFGVAQQMAGGDDLMLAKLLYFDPDIPTVPGEVQEADLSDAQHAERVLAGKASAERRHAEAEAREGMTPIGGAPKPKATPEEMAARGYDRTPEKGEVALESLGDAADTQELYQPEGDVSHLRPEDRYTDARIRTVHDPIIKALTEGHAGHDEPHALIVAGGPASGKSTFLHHASGLEPDDAVRLNADDIAFGEGPHDGIPEAGDMLRNRDPYAAYGSHREAGDIFEKAEQRAVAGRQNLVMDVTGDGQREEFERQLQRLHDAGYKVDMLYVSTPTDRAVEQNIHRAETEGRYVPTPVVRAKHRLVAEHFPHIAAHSAVSSVRVYDPELGLVAFRNEDGEMEPTHEGGYARWMDKAKEPLADERTERAVVREAAETPEPMVIGVPFELQSREAAHRDADALLKKRPQKQ